ncbi:glycosyltransferase family 2 protein [Rathayibacter sp. YIM 133350]|uniref:glycosyltransferase family 2 protein n=1 Tax=Rathayibacter sp. YIM 133350 TaxID=3131992 RepID=UPI00307D9806
MSSFRTSVIIVSYNSSDDIRDCVQALRGSEGTEVVVVDNASSDGTPGLLRALESEGLIDVLVLSAENLGFGKGVNLGIRSSHGEDLLLLNPDARLDVDALAALRERSLDPSIGIVAPVIHSGPTIATMAAGEQPRLWPMFTQYTGIARAFPNVSWLRGRHLFFSPHAASEQSVGWVSGGCMYIPARTRAAVGMLSERWFMYGEDIEFCHRVTKAGFKIIVTPTASAEHAIGASVNRSDGAVSTMWAQNTYDYYVTEFSAGPIRRFLWRVIFSGGLLSRAVLFDVKAARSETHRDELRGRSRRFRAFADAVWRPRRAVTG